VSVAAPAPRPADAPPRPRPRALPRRAAHPRRLTFGGAAWVVLLAALLAGIVALNVGALRASIDLNRLEAREQALRAQNGELSAVVGKLSAPGRIAARARRLHMVLADPEATRYLQLRPARGRRAPAR
jgi:hypothetical protein